ncbi:nitroimidazol reductase NimA-like FMN-containing flavoprotein (pyridoxamine 5'-phosphate oxidase superfamily) [Arthrobacter pascens]|nr:pyridoxamine 5'-phosphate oxidase family protein [Arthrobacter pascens]MDR6556688.1 nitroimidazol reductase NimA-like FMN-containing flavoprotein (pyridoxamine 5'-phosphate oxidase superfamily) [Arthrobacter pascens]
MTNDAAATGSPSQVENLDSGQCLDLLRQVSVGRLAVWVDDHPDIFPLNYTVDHGTLVFRTGEGTKLAGALGETPPLTWWTQLSGAIRSSPE